MALCLHNVRFMSNNRPPGLDFPTCSRQDCDVAPLTTADLERYMDGSHALSFGYCQSEYPGYVTNMVDLS